jgi:hypothetical protein
MQDYDDDDDIKNFVDVSSCEELIVFNRIIFLRWGKHPILQYTRGPGLGIIQVGGEGKLKRIQHQ